MQVRGQVVEAFGKARLSINPMRIWCAADSLLPVRVERKFLLGLKKLLLSWGWQDSKYMSIQMQISFQSMATQVTRLSDPALTELVSDCETSMRERKVGKGAGK